MACSLYVVPWTTREKHRRKLQFKVGSMPDGWLVRLTGWSPGSSPATSWLRQFSHDVAADQSALDVFELCSDAPAPTHARCGRAARAAAARPGHRGATSKGQLPNLCRSAR